MRELTQVSKWSQRFLKLAEHIATWSKDPSTKVGSVIVRGKFIVSVGFNGFAAKTSDAVELYEDRSVKYNRVLHSEINALLSAKQDLTDCTLYCSAPLCAQCMAAVIQSRITTVITNVSDLESREPWATSCREAEIMAKEAEITYIQVKK